MFGIDIVTLYPDKEQKYLLLQLCKLSIYIHNTIAEFIIKINKKPNSISELSKIRSIKDTNFKQLFDKIPGLIAFCMFVFYRSLAVLSGEGETYKKNIAHKISGNDIKYNKFFISNTFTKFDDKYLDILGIKVRYKGHLSLIKLNKNRSFVRFIDGKIIAHLEGVKPNSNKKIITKNNNKYIKILGIDLGASNTAYLSTGDKFSGQLKFVIDNIMRVIKENNFNWVAIENLDNSRLMGNMGKIYNHLQGRLSNNNINVIRINRYFASSQTCSNCGHKCTITKDLSVRSWACPSCGTVLDRDINASINLAKQGDFLIRTSSILPYKSISKHLSSVWYDSSDHTKDNQKKY